MAARTLGGRPQKSRTPVGVARSRREKRPAPRHPEEPESAARCEHRQALEFTRTSPLLVWLTQGEIGLYGGDKRAAPFPTLKPAKGCGEQRPQAVRVQGERNGTAD
jgi:hypothetical protein